MFGCKLLPEMDSFGFPLLFKSWEMKEILSSSFGSMARCLRLPSKDFWLKTLKDLTMDSSAGCRPTIGWVLPLVKNNPIGDRHLLMRKVLMCFQYWSWSAAYITRFYHDGLLF